MLIIYRARLGFHSQEGGSAPPAPAKQRYPHGD
jgi:hypothetical protein